MRRILNRSVLARRLPGSTKRLSISKKGFSAEAQGAKVHKSSTPPPPPPPPQKGSGTWILLTGALIGGGYYFKDDIKAWWDKTSNDVPLPAVPATTTKDIVETNVEKVKEEIKEIEEKLPVLNESKEVKPVSTSTEVDWNKVREEIVSVMDDSSFDFGSYGPVLVRLAWHSAGTYDKKSGKGGTEGAAMRFNPESDWGANKGLHKARNLLEKVKAKFPSVTYSDLWSFAGTVAIEEMGGPEIKWRPGRKDYLEGENVLPDGLLPDADGRDDKTNVSKHIRFIFNRMGFNDQEIVALMGAHALGGCHTENSGYLGPWTFAPTTFSNEYFRLLVEEKWVKKTTEKGKPWTGPEQYTDSTGELMMLPTDMEMINDSKFKKWTEIYAKDEERFFKDFAKAWIKLQENGVKKFNGWKRYIFFGPRG